MGCSTSNLAPRQQKCSDGIFLYTGQSTIPRDITRVRVDQSVKAIGAWAFEHCDLLTEVELHEGLTKIEDHAFCNCTSLTFINIPSTTKVIGKRAFRNCNRLGEVLLNEGLEQIEDEAFLDCTSLKLVRMPSSMKVIAYGVFCGCTRLEEVNLCEGLEQIGSKAFFYNASLKHIRIPSTIKVISNVTFFYCEQLEEVELCEGVEEIEENAFQYCKLLRSIAMPPTVKVVGKGAFARCGQLEKVQLCEGLEEIGRSAFAHCRSLKFINIPSTVKVIEESSFRFCKQLEGVNLSEGLEQIRRDAFYYCKSLKQIETSPLVKVKSIEWKGVEQPLAFNAFSNCKALNGIIVPSTVKGISSQAFENCQQLVSAEICDEIQHLDKSAFQYCPSLRNIAIPPRAQATCCFGLCCHDLLQLFGSQEMIPNALKSRFEGLPIHKLCYYQSHHPAQVTIEQLRLSPLNMFSKPENTQDCLGMTTLHILACSRKHVFELYQFIIDRQPKSLIIEDRWGCPPILYAVWGNAPHGIVQYLISCQKHSFPDHCLNWEKMLETLCRAGTSLDIVMVLLELQQTSFPEDKVNWRKVARELTIHSLVVCESFGDHSSIWTSMMQKLTSSHAHEDLIESLILIQQRFFPIQPDANWKMLCEEFVSPLNGWWQHNNISSNIELFRFLVKCRIQDRMEAIGARKWQMNMINMVKEISMTRYSRVYPFDAIHSKLVSYEQFKEAISLLELALWKSKFDQSERHKDDAAGTKTQCRINCGADVIVPNVLPFLNYGLKNDTAMGQDCESPLALACRREGPHRRRRRQIQVRSEPSFRIFTRSPS